MCFVSAVLFYTLHMPGTQNLLFFPRLDLDPSSRFVYLRSESNEFRQSAHFRSDSESYGDTIEYRTKGGGDLRMYPNRRWGTFHHIEQNTPEVGLCVRWCCRQSQQVPAIAVACTAMPDFPISLIFLFPNSFPLPCSGAVTAAGNNK